MVDHLLYFFSFLVRVYKVLIQPEVGIRDKGPRDPASRSRIFGTGTGTGTEFLIRARDRYRRSSPARDPGRDTGLKIVKNGTRDRTRDRKLKKKRDVGQAILDTWTSDPYCPGYFFRSYFFEFFEFRPKVVT